MSFADPRHDPGMTTYEPVSSDHPVTSRRVRAQLSVCVGCCCGRVDRGHPAVPVDALKAAWKEHDLGKHVHLSVSGCLGPCDLTNVALLMHGDRQRWLGHLETAEHYEQLVAWARDVAERGDDAPWPAALDAHVFDRWAEAEA